MLSGGKLSARTNSLIATKWSTLKEIILYWTYIQLKKKLKTAINISRKGNGYIFQLQ